MGFKGLFFGALLPFCTTSVASNLNELIDLSLKNEEYLMRELAAFKAQNERKSVARAYLPELSLQGGYLSNGFDNFLTSPKNILHSAQPRFTLTTKACKA